jgi:hypothetical protein
MLHFGFIFLAESELFIVVGKDIRSISFGQLFSTGSSLETLSDSLHHIGSVLMVNHAYLFLD